MAQATPRPPLLRVVTLPGSGRCEYCPQLTSQGVTTVHVVGQLVLVCPVHLPLGLCPRLWTVLEWRSDASC